MLKTSVIGDVRAVVNIGPEFQFLSDSQDVAPVKEHVGESASDYDSFFVRVADGDYAEVWGMCGIVPFTSKLVRRLL